MSTTKEHVQRPGLYSFDPKDLAPHIDALAKRDGETRSSIIRRLLWKAIRIEAAQMAALTKAASR